MDATEAALRRVAEWQSLNPWFLGHQLTEYAHARGLSESALVAELGIRTEQLTDLCLCRHVRDERDVARLVEVYGVNADALRRVAGL